MVSTRPRPTGELVDRILTAAKKSERILDEAELARLVAEHHRTKARP